jgi:hypothetical protein
MWGGDKSGDRDVKTLMAYNSKYALDEKNYFRVLFRGPGTTDS